MLSTFIDAAAGHSDSVRFIVRSVHLKLLKRQIRLAIACELEKYHEF